MTMPKDNPIWFKYGLLDIDPIKLSPLPSPHS